MKFTLQFSLLVALLLIGSTAVGQTVTTITSEFGASGGVSAGPDGNIYVGDFGVALNNSNGTVVHRVTPAGDVTTFATGLAGASGNVFDDDGNLFQSNIGGNRISRITPDGTVTTYATTGIVAPVGVTVDAAGNVYNTNCQSPGRISITTPGGTTTTFATSSLMSCPNGLTIDDDGNLYTANFNDGRVVKITPGGTVSVLATVNASRGNGHLTFANGRLYVCNWSGRIYELLLDGQFRVLAGTGIRGTDDGPADQATFNRPNGISATVTGDTLYINQSTQVVAPADPQLHPNVVRMITGVLATTDAEVSPDEFPDGLGLNGSMPNPFTESTRISFSLAGPEAVTVTVYNVLGRLVRTLVDDIRPGGQHAIAWDGRDDAGSRVASGVYTYTLEAGSSRDARSVVVVR